MSKIRAVLLDADGVVIKNHDYFSNRYKKDFGKSLNDDVITNFFRNEYKQTAIGKSDLKKLLKERLENRTILRASFGKPHSLSFFGKIFL